MPPVLIKSILTADLAVYLLYKHAQLRQSKPSVMSAHVSCQAVSSETCEREESALAAQRLQVLAGCKSMYGSCLPAYGLQPIQLPKAVLNSAYPLCSNANSANCALGTDRGTSMSTPVVAGAVALLRQYFMQGFYPTGAAVAGSAYTPSGPLLKAVLLGNFLLPHESHICCVTSRSFLHLHNCI